MKASHFSDFGFSSHDY